MCNFRLLSLQTIYVLYSQRFIFFSFALEMKSLKQNIKRKQNLVSAWISLSHENRKWIEMKKRRKGRERRNRRIDFFETNCPVVHETKKFEIEKKNKEKVLEIKVSLICPSLKVSQQIWLPSKQA